MEFNFSIKDDVKLPRNVIGSREIQEAMRRSVFLVWSDAQSHAPVEHGTLRSSINSRILGTREDLEGTVFSAGVKYAHYLEYGTKYIKVGTPEKPLPSKKPYTQRPYMRSALHRNKGTIIVLFRDATKRAIRKRGMR